MNHCNEHLQEKLLGERGIILALVCSSLRGVQKWRVDKERGGGKWDLGA